MHRSRKNRDVKGERTPGPVIRIGRLLSHQTTLFSERSPARELACCARRSPPPVSPNLRGSRASVLTTDAGGGRSQNAFGDARLRFLNGSQRGAAVVGRAAGFFWSWWCVADRRGCPDAPETFGRHHRPRNERRRVHPCFIRGIRGFLSLVFPGGLVHSQPQAGYPGAFSTGAVHRASTGAE